MKKKFVSFWDRFLAEDLGVTLVEYGIAISLAVLVGANVLLVVLANDVGNAMGNAGAQMP